MKRKVVIINGTIRRIETTFFTKTLYRKDGGTESYAKTLGEPLRLNRLCGKISKQRQ